MTGDKQKDQESRRLENVKATRDGSFEVRKYPLLIVIEDDMKKFIFLAFLIPRLSFGVMAPARDLSLGGDRPASSPAVTASFVNPSLLAEVEGY